MKITEQKLKQMIKEELGRVLGEEKSEAAQLKAELVPLFNLYKYEVGFDPGFEGVVYLKAPQDHPMYKQHHDEFGGDYPQATVEKKDGQYEVEEPWPGREILRVNSPEEVIEIVDKGMKKVEHEIQNAEREY